MVTPCWLESQPRIRVGSWEKDHNSNKDAFVIKRKTSLWRASSSGKWDQRLICFKILTRNKRHVFTQSVLVAPLPQKCGSSGCLGGLRFQPLVLASAQHPSEVTPTVLKSFMLKNPSDDIKLYAKKPIWWYYDRYLHGMAPSEHPVKITVAERAEYFHKPTVTLVLRSPFLLGGWISKFL